jgi:uncharacterized membrane protein required for colicin V production
MALALTIGLSLVLLTLTVLGYFRDLRRNLIALLGTLVGALLVNFWGAQWGASVGRWIAGVDPQRTTLWVSCLVFVWCALLVGYGGGRLIPRVKESAMSQRITGAVLGLLNGVLIISFLLRYITVQESTLTPLIKADVLANLLTNGLPWLFLGTAIIVTLLVLVRGMLGLVGRRSVPAASSTPAAASASAKPPVSAAAASSAAPDRRVGARDIIGKIDDATKR